MSRRCFPLSRALSWQLCVGLTAISLHGPVRAEQSQEATETPATREAAGTIQLDATSIESESLSESTENSGSYAPGGTVIGGKGPQKLREIAQSVTVITSKRLEDQQLKTMDQVMNQMTGVTRQEA